MLIQAQALYLGFLLDRLHVKKGLALAYFPEAEHYPTTQKIVRSRGVNLCRGKHAGGWYSPEDPTSIIGGKFPRDAVLSCTH